ncbi:MAG: hypothetical protein ACJAS4_001218 [Bacteriovoracaceae bacterium]|jgi:hypothetical protein
MKNKNSVISRMPVSNGNMRPRQMLLFSGVFLGIGGYIILISLGIINFRGRINAPLEILLLCGLVFFLGGLSVFSKGFAGLGRIRNKDKYQRSHKYSPWRWDYDWSVKGILSRSKNNLLNHFVGLSIFSCFLGITYWIGFILKDGFKLPFYGMCVFSLIILFWFYTMISKRVRYGKPFLRFLKYPFFLGEELHISFENIPHREQVEEINVTIRFYEEIFQKNSKNETRVVLNELYADSITLSGKNITTTREVEAKFNLPNSVEFNNELSSSPAKFWEAQIQCDIKGWDYREYFLLPIYKK